MKGIFSFYPKDGLIFNNSDPKEGAASRRPTIRWRIIVKDSTSPEQYIAQQSKWHNHIVCYDHKRRQCFDETIRAKPSKITIDQAREAFESGTLSDFNLALRQLAIQDWDMEAVEQYYREQDSMR